MRAVHQRWGPVPDTGLLTCVFIYLFRSRGTAYVALIAFYWRGLFCTSIC